MTLPVGGITLPGIKGVMTAEGYTWIGYGHNEEGEERILIGSIYPSRSPDVSNIKEYTWDDFPYEYINAILKLKKALKTYPFSYHATKVHPT